MHGHWLSGREKESYTSPEMRQLLDMVWAQFQGESSPLLDLKGVWVSISILDFEIKRSGSRNDRFSSVFQVFEWTEYAAFDE